MFKKNENKVNERVIYQTKPNLIFGCKKAILGFILLIFLLCVSGPIIQFIGEMQVYMISHVKLSLTRYTAIAIFVVMLLIIIYIIWQIIGWYAKEYVLTDSRIMVKSGVLLTRKNYMPYSTIQDINTSQSIISRLFKIGSVSVYSAYDNTSMVFENISNPSEVEEIIFSKISGPRMFNPNFPRQNPMNPANPHQNMQSNHYMNYPEPSNDYYMDEPDDYDDYVAITPIHHEEEEYQRREYDYYPEDLNYNNPSQRPKYEYEPYEHNLEQNIDRAMNGGQEAQNAFRQDSYYDDAGQDYSYGSDDGYYNNEREVYQNENAQKDSKSQMEESSEKVIKRHFDKFKK